MNVISFEIAHIYADEAYGQEQASTVALHNRITRVLRRRGIPFATTVLVDDANADPAAFDPDAYAGILDAAGARPQAIAFEARFREAAQALTDAIPTALLRTELIRKDGRRVLMLDDGAPPIGLSSMHNEEIRPSCALLSAAWSLCRLGLHPFPAGSIHGDPKACRAQLVVNILPDRYRPTEAKVLRILKAAGHEKHLARLRSIFVPARPEA